MNAVRKHFKKVVRKLSKRRNCVSVYTDMQERQYEVVCMCSAHLVYFASGDVIITREGKVHESFIVAQIQIHLQPHILSAFQQLQRYLTHSKS